VPGHERSSLDDCEIGDLVEFDDGQRAVLTAHLAGAPFGRYLDENGESGEFCPLIQANLRWIRNTVVR